MKKVSVIKIIALICIIAIPAYNICKLLITNNIFITKAKIDTSAVEEIEKADIDDVKKKIDRVNPHNTTSQTNTSTSSSSDTAAASIGVRNYDTTGPDRILKMVQNGETTYSKIFKDSIIAGDSLIEALSVYSVLDSDIVMGKVNASLYELDNISGKIISYRPSLLILHYGENHVGGPNQKYVDLYISQYRDLIKKFQTELPDTRIVISSIFIPSEKGLQGYPHLKAVPMFNEALEKLCSELGVEYLDNSPLFSSGDTSFYEGDGMHFKKVFYTDYWLPYIASNLNLA